MDDYKDYTKMRGAMAGIGINDADIMDMFRVVAGVLHLGNIEFMEEEEGSSGKMKLEHGDCVICINVKISQETFLFFL